MFYPCASESNDLRPALINKSIGTGFKLEAERCEISRVIRLELSKNGKRIFVGSVGQTERFIDEVLWRREMWAKAQILFCTLAVAFCSVAVFLTSVATDHQDDIYCLFYGFAACPLYLLTLFMIYLLFSFKSKMFLDSK